MEHMSASRSSEYASSLSNAVQPPQSDGGVAQPLANVRPSASTASQPSSYTHDTPSLPGMHSTILPAHVRRAHRRRVEVGTLIFFDIIAVVVGFILAYWIRYDLEIVREVSSWEPLSSFTPTILLLLVTTIGLLWTKGAYHQPRSLSWLPRLGPVASSVVTATGITIVVTFLYKPIYFSRLIFFLAGASIAVLLALTRLLMVVWRRRHWRHGRNLDRVLVVGGTGLGLQVMSNLADSATTGYQLVGFVADPSEPDAPPSRFIAETHAPCFGPLSTLPQVVAQQDIDHIIIALPFWQHKALPHVVEQCNQLGVDYQVVPDFYELSFDRISIQELHGTPLVELRRNQITGANYLVKRVLDITLVILSIPVWGLIALIVAGLIKLTSPGPVIYRQTRIGRHGRPFEFLKFRTMVANADDLKDHLLAYSDGSGPQFKMKQDPRITPLGRILRRWSLDELPQLWNVLRGEMSLVGPRPSIPEEVFQYEPWHRRRLEVTPGVTGLWQTTGRSDMRFEEMVRLDIYYIEHWSIWLDLRILLATIPSVVTGRGAY
jgi:exopolysaccharide biosynthesis polyprenyl glycosylphosphotransferase